MALIDILSLSHNMVYSYLLITRSPQLRVQHHTRNRSRILYHISSIVSRSSNPPGRNAVSAKFKSLHLASIYVRSGHGTNVSTFIEPPAPQSPHFHPPLLIDVINSMLPAVSIHTRLSELNARTSYQLGLHNLQPPCGGGCARCNQLPFSMCILPILDHRMFTQRILTLSSLSPSSSRILVISSPYL